MYALKNYTMALLLILIHVAFIIQVFVIKGCDDTYHVFTCTF